MPSPPRLYLDHAATTPILPVAADAMANAVRDWANPSSPHGDGRKAKAMLENARTRIAAALDWDGEILFTSGASEAIHMALSGFDACASAVEHSVVHFSTGMVGQIPVGDDGLVRLPAIIAGRRYAIQQVNNETGVVQPLAEIGEMIRRSGGLLFADCAQSAGKLPLPNADFISISAHKMGGPPGVGALLLRDMSLLRSTGGQEQGYRRGTENLPGIMAFAAALENGYAWMDGAAKLRKQLEQEILQAGGEIVAAHIARLATIGGYRMPGVSAQSQLIGFDLAGISVSAGSACSSGTIKSSPVLAAMGWGDQAASEVIRVSFGPETTMADTERFISSWRSINERALTA